jgi:DNA primase catalytic core
MVFRAWLKKITGIQEVMNSVAEGYHSTLQNNLPANEYLAGRNIKPETIEFWEIGYAPGFDNYQRSSGPTLGILCGDLYLPTLAQQGLIVPIKKYINKDTGTLKSSFDPTNYSQYRDFFINRIMFPVKDQLGRVVGFVGRALDPEGQPKYSNSGERTLISREPTLFRKGKVLFGYYQAREHIKESKKVIITEGQLDLIHAWQHGVRDIVAITGSSFTDDQAGLLKRHSNLEEVILAFDGDEAGVEATKKAARVLFRAGLGVPSVYDLLEGKDLDDFVREHGDDSSSELEKCKVSFIDFYLDHTEGITENPNSLAQAVEGLVGHIDVNNTNAVSQMFWLKYIIHKMSEGIADRGGILEVTPEIIWTQYNQEFRLQLKQGGREQDIPRLDHPHQIYKKAKEKLIRDSEFHYTEFPEFLQEAVWKYFSYLLTAGNNVAQHYIEKIPLTGGCFNDEQRELYSVLIDLINQTNEPLAIPRSKNQDLFGYSPDQAAFNLRLDAFDYIRQLEHEGTIEYIPAGLEDVIVNPLSDNNSNNIEGIVSVIETVIKAEELGPLLSEILKAGKSDDHNLKEELFERYLNLLREIGIEDLEQF